MPTVKWTGGSELLQMETLSDAETGYLAADAVGLKIVFGAQKAAVANYYAEIEAVERKATDVLSVSGDPMAYGTVDPDYGKHVGYVAGVEYTLAAPSVWMSEDELTQSVCIGCVVTNIGGAEIASETYSGDGETRSVTFVYPECENGVEAVWRWEVLNKVAVTATDGGSVSSSGGWYAYGQGLAVTATPDDGCMFLQWVDRRTGAVLGTDPSLAIAVETPLDVSAVFMSESEIVFDPSVVDYTPIIRGLVVNAEEGAVITMQPGVYPLATPLVVDKAVTLQGAADGGTVLKGAYVRNSVENNVSQLSVSGGATLDHIAITGGSGASPLWNAPGIGVSISSGTLSWCAITNNVYDGVGNSYGVGVYVDIASNDMVTITHCRICDNRSNAVYNHSKGVGLYAAGAGTLLMDNCLVAGNRTEKGTAGSPDVAGGGLYLSLSDALIVNCTIVDNLHGNRGGGVAVYGDDEALYTPSLCNCIIAGNTADEDPCVYGPDVSATRLSDDGDVAPEIFNACSNNLVRAGLTPFGVNGIVADPCFEPGSYRIQPSSPAHNAGLKLPWMTWTVDLDGNPRFRRTIDIGCYECFEAPMGTMIYIR